MTSFLPVNFITCVIADQLERFSCLRFWRLSLFTNVITFERVPGGIAKPLNMQGLWHFTRVYGQYP
ncbi:hypothetical protein A0J48_010090 [Sphaerospermopsis aphanizomenoides BCCUSP55]|uniref:hypothetical protein n=1 Tax=Sphaerospermopsis aphanizomenoides TaxID=459663 RepID=UPI001F34AEA8|nr:hypothetical protein [Sphaerospermopsis aphanizomenoides]MBK1987884.1 hypothetical protein [Sphaerospermopsis aphanizomenoides BCCUSP55]